MKTLSILAFLGFFMLGASAQSDQKMILVTLDGFRWEELFGGAVDSLMSNNDFVKDTSELQQRFDGRTPKERRQRLMPWFWSTMVEEGQIYGNRNLDCKVNLTNIFWFSYPGYNEILTGYSDPLITSNKKKYNENETVLEWFNKQEQFEGKVAAFGSWDVFPYIINDRRSGIPVNAGFANASHRDLTEREEFLNEIQSSVPSPWAAVRLDFFTHHYALEYMKSKHPRVVYLSYGETDDFAHDGRYDHYLKSAHQTDEWLRDLWTFVQTDSFYADRTTLIITTDHGRGHTPAREWTGHGKTYEGSNATWIAAIGPQIKNKGEIHGPLQLWSNQIAKTAAALMGLEYTNTKEEVGQVITKIIE